MRLAIASLFLMSTFAFPANAADWARSMFGSTSHDFGTVARAAKTEYQFQFENRSNQTIHVRSVRTSCGCTTPIIVTETVEPGQTGTILARFNTHTHTGQRQATVTVTFDRPQFTEVQLLVKGYIRSDIVFNPGEGHFGTIEEGAEKSISIDLDYAGRSDWKILEVGSGDNFISATSEEISRGNGRVKYRLDVKLAGNAPAGPLQSELIVKTNDRNMKTVPLRLLGTIQPTVAVSPQLMALGSVKPGEPIKQVLVLKGQQPFRIVDISSKDFEVRFEPNTDSKPLHTLPLTISPLAATGEIQGKIFVKTDLPGDTVLSLDATCVVQTQSQE